MPNANWLTYGKAWANYAQVGGDAPYYDVYNTYTVNTPIHGCGCHERHDCAA